MLDYYRYMHNNCYYSFFSTWYLAIWVNTWCCTLYSHRTPACHTWYLIRCTCQLYLTHGMTPILAMLYLTHDIWHPYLPWYIWHMISAPVLVMLYLILDIWHQYLPCYIWHMISDTSTCHAIFDTWYPTPVLASYTWHMIYDTSTWHVIPDTWYLTINMLSPGTSTHDMILWHLTGDYYTWHPYYLAYSWLSLLRGLDMIIILLSDLWYSWTSVHLNPCTPELLYPLYSCLLYCYSC